MNKKVVSIDFKFDYTMLRNDLKAFKKAYDLKWHEIDALADLGHGVSNNVYNGVENNKINTILALANAMDIDIRTYFVLDV